MKSQYNILVSQFIFFIVLPSVNFGCAVVHAYFICVYALMLT